MPASVVDTPFELSRRSINPVSQKILQTIVIVGNGPVGFSLLEKLVERCDESSLRLVVFGEEPRLAYDRVKLTSVFAGGTPDDLQFAPLDWYEANEVELFTGDPVVAIDRDRHLVCSRSGVEVKYDKLILATGSRPFVPPIEGAELPRVFVYRTIEDLLAIRQECASARSAAVMGGGLLGLEAARALLDFGLETHIVEMAPVLMPRQLDSVGAEYLKSEVVSLGVNVHLLKRTERITAREERVVLDFGSGDELEVDLVVISAGIRPRDELARECGIEVGPRGGIVVDDQLQTSDLNVLAIGECARHQDRIYGLAAPGYRMAEVVAQNLTGGKDTFVGSDESTKLKLMGVDVSLCGEYLDTSQAEVLTSQSTDSYRKLILRNQRLIGAVGVGDFPELPRIQEAVSKNRRLWKWNRRRFMEEGSLWPPPSSTDVNNWPSGAVVCSCKGLSRGELTTAYRAGCESIEAIAKKTGASTVCGSCRPLLAEIVGSPFGETPKVPGSRWLLGASLATTVAVIAWLAWGPIPFSQSVQDPWRSVERLWQDSFWKQVTGFSLLGLVCLALMLSLRKRIRRLNFLSLGLWRAAHGVLGFVTVLGVMLHTGMHFGSHLNSILLITFLTINVVGALTGMLTAIEQRVSGELAQLIRRWRPRLTLLHIFVFWPFPVLVAFHIIAFYWL